MPVMPYKRRPVPPVVCLLTREGRVLSEHGEEFRPAELPVGHRCWASYDTVHGLVRDGLGEALCWNREEIRWRHGRLEDGWKARHTDVSVIRLPFDDDQPTRTLRALSAWRDWLARYGASPSSTTGSAAWSLLRARLAAPLWLSAGTCPPFKQTLGGRQQLGLAGAGRYDGVLEHHDLPAAYASELGHLRYGGHWRHSADLPVQREPAWWALDGRPVFVRAVVRVPEWLPFGPLPRRPRKRMHGLRAHLLGATYPTGRQLQGIWTWQEVEQALEHGCRLQRVLDLWVHLAPDRPFLPWWRAVEDGRRMPGLAGLLAKTTGNALWGRFCMDVTAAGERHIRRRHGRRLDDRPLPHRPGLPPAHDLAETVSGRTRARLYELMMVAGGRLVSAHTDGAWTVAGEDLHLEGWRLKEQARRLDVLDPQVLRYWPARRREGEPFHVFAGQPASMAADAFETAWAEAGFAA